jgi:hypothetical protein
MTDFLSLLKGIFCHLIKNVISTTFTGHHDIRSSTKYRHMKELNVSNIISEIDCYNYGE